MALPPSFVRSGVERRLPGLHSTPSHQPNLWSPDTPSMKVTREILLLYTQIKGQPVMNFKHMEILQSLHLIMNLPSLLEMPEPFLRGNRTGSVGFISSITRSGNISIFSISYTCGTLNETCSRLLIEPRVLCLLHKLTPSSSPRFCFLKPGVLLSLEI